MHIDKIANFQNSSILNDLPSTLLGTALLVTAVTTGIITFLGMISLTVGAVTSLSCLGISITLFLMSMRGENSRANEQRRKYAEAANFKPTPIDNNPTALAKGFKSIANRCDAISTMIRSRS